MNTKVLAVSQKIPIIICVMGVLMLAAVLLIIPTESLIGKILTVIGSICTIAGFMVWNERR